MNMLSKHPQFWAWELSSTRRGRVALELETGGQPVDFHVKYGDSDAGGIDGSIAGVGLGRGFLWCVCVCGFFVPCVSEGPQMCADPAHFDPRLPDSTNKTPVCVCVCVCAPVLRDKKTWGDHEI